VNACCTDLECNNLKKSLTSAGMLNHKASGKKPVMGEMASIAGTLEAPES